MSVTWRTGLVWHELLMWHDTSPFAGMLLSGHGVLEPDEATEHAATKRRLKNLLDVAGLTDQLVAIKPRPATDDELLLIHTRDYVETIKSMSHKSGGDASLGRIVGPTPFGPGGFEIAALAAGGMIAAVDAIVGGEVRNCYALVRPPGHHAEPDHGFGFCMFNNAAIAARYARAHQRLDRIALVDWDVHHGNGAQHIFWTAREVLTISIHQDSTYPPGSGAMSEIGAGPGEGHNLNIPLPPGSGAGAYLAAFERVIVPALHRFKPDLIIVPCGFDAGAYDPMARMMLHSEAFRAMTHMIQTAADALCGGRLVLCHEGGYHRTSVPFYGLAVIEQLSGIRTTIEDPFLPIAQNLPSQALQPHQAKVIKAAEQHLAKI
jgi:acetoin utilization deacetylase AcuC-like enzyme